MALITLDVPGIPAPQGSKKAYVRGGRAILVESSAKVEPWRSAVAWTARHSSVRQDWSHTTDAVAIHIAFTLPRPKSLAKKIQAHTKKPDLDKLIRSTLDGITDAGTIWGDDSQVVKLVAKKEYGEKTGALITIEVAA